jgi:transposase
VDDRIHREYGRAPRGREVRGEVSGKKTERLSMIASLRGKKLEAPFRFEGYCDTDVFNTWVEECLLETLQAGDTVILDNASFHTSARTRELIESKQARLLPLTTYSPDLNPIEQYWAIAKARIRKNRKPGQSLPDIIDEVLLSLCN